MKSNFVSLSLLQAGNYILPLLTLPYLVKVLGIEYFGLLAFATATIAYFGILTDYGFNLTATKEISIHRKNHLKITEIFSSVMSIKFLLLLISLFLLTAIVFSFNKLSAHWEIYLLTFGSVIGQFLFPVWFFQGMERMKYITYLNFLSKLIFTIAIFVFVQEQNDAYLVPLFFSVGSIIAGIASLVLIKQQFNLSFKFQNWATITHYLIDGWHVFLSRFYVSMYTTTNIVLLGVMTNNVAVGYYSIVEKIVLAIGGVFNPINQTIYPYLARKFKDNFEIYVDFLKKVSLIFIALASVFLLFSQYFIEEIIQLVHGEYNAQISFLLSIFLLRILILPFGALLSNSLIIMHRKQEFIRVMNYTVLVDLLIVPLSIYFFKETGLVISFLIIIFVHTLFLWYYVNQAIQEEKNKKVKIKND
ncbi:MAG: Membrane protein involved in the export of O-antigen, teichoic acid lipoteichoic acids [uncultured Sulfurovum sp.]|uniref:Membrane protein involved in the export of O-antigen, teichoic acid lipoteichoic acids n=1 Tax=uncultured Sulfurovum sp. TaxID=269237 RepID=A0A6S6RUG1_9BACT|nr:MAG: Membrane protein involved in the export of O-antigen, teichoic acid lipoteichoic acids [uncultured Sulfurovum sp.]